MSPIAHLSLRQTYVAADTSVAYDVRDSIRFAHVCDRNLRGRKAASAITRPPWDAVGNAPRADGAGSEVIPTPDHSGRVCGCRSGRRIGALVPSSGRCEGAPNEGVNDDVGPYANAPRAARHVRAVRSPPRAPHDDRRGGPPAQT